MIYHDLKKTAKYTRSVWPAGQYLFSTPNGMIYGTADCWSKYADGAVQSWMPTQEDLTAKDWRQL